MPYRLALDIGANSIGWAALTLSPDGHPIGLADAGVRVGLRRDLALELVAQTMLGSARMVQDSGRHPASLRDDVTTPAGCTIGGLLMLEDGKIRSVLARAVEEATRIVAELGKAAKPAGQK